MPDVITPVENQPWPQADYYDEAATWSASGVIGASQATVGAGPLGLTLNGLGWSLGLGSARVDGSRYRRTVSAATGSSAPNTNGTLSRRDRLVVRRDLAAKTAVPLLLQGTPQATPLNPALTQVRGGVYDLPLFSWLVGPSSSTTLTDVRDERRWLLPDGQGGPLHGIRLVRTSSVLIGSGGASGQGFATTDIVGNDPDGYYTSNAGGSTLTIPAGLGGLYVVGVSASLSGVVNARCFAEVMVASPYRSLVRANGAFDDTPSASRPVPLAAGEVIGVNVLQQSGGQLSITNLQLSAHLVGT